MLEFDGTITIPLIVSLITIVFAWFRTRRSAIDDRLRAVDARLEERSVVVGSHDKRLLSLEQTVKHMPGMEDIHKIELGMERLVGTMNRIEAVLDGNHQIMGRLETIVTRHEEHLLNRGGR